MNRDFPAFKFEDTSSHRNFQELEDPDRHALLFEAPDDNVISLEQLNKKIFSCGSTHNDSR